MLAVWLTMCSTVVPMARGGRGDIPGKDSVLVVVRYTYICHIYIIYISVTSRVLVHDATSLRNFDMTPTDSTKTEVTIRFPVKNYSRKVISSLFDIYIYPLHNLS